MEASLREWWLSFQAGPELLFLVRLTLAGIATVGWWLCAWNVVRPNVVESVWEDSDYVRFRLVHLIKVVGYTGLVFYLTYGGVVESERTSSPHRLLFANTFLFLLVVGDIGAMVLRRLTNLRKRAAAARLERTPL